MRFIHLWKKTFDWMLIPFTLLTLCCNGGHNILRLLDILQNFSFATGEKWRDSSAQSSAQNDNYVNATEKQDIPFENLITHVSRDELFYIKSKTCLEYFLHDYRSHYSDVSQTGDVLELLSTITLIFKVNRLVEEDSQNFVSRKKLYVLRTQKDIRRDGEPLNSTFVCGYSIFLLW